VFGRIAIVVLFAALLWAVFARDTGAGAHPTQYRVRAGDTLWSIAVSRLDGDPREGVWRIQRANGLDGAAISPGQRLLIP
jgi:nucleoid-associated protein YgaU